jgi:serine/threonine-protein kinase RsbW
MALCTTVQPTPDRHDMVAHSFSLHLTNTPRSVRRALAEIRDRIKASGASVDTLSRIEIALAEVLNNVVEHALQHAEDGDIQVVVTAQDGDWHFKVSDNGVALPGDGLPNPPLPKTNLPLADLPEGGFGWAIVNMLADDLRYIRKEGRNVLSFVMTSH